MQAKARQFRTALVCCCNQRFGARRWIARIMVTWGLLSAGMVFVQGPYSFYLVRFLLGFAEAGRAVGATGAAACWL